MTRRRENRGRLTPSVYLAYLVCLALALAALGLQRLAATRPEMVERDYSTTVFPVIGQTLSRLFGWLPFSMAEALVWVSPLVAAAWIIGGVRAARRLGWWRAVGRRLAGLLAILCLVYFGFVAFWGMNYSRRPFAAIAGLPTRPGSVDELTALCRDLISRTNALRLKVPEDANGVMKLSDSIEGTLRRATLGYARAATLYPVLGGRYSAPKGVRASDLWSYTGIEGVYFPFTGEANVNIAMPPSAIPAAATHEMAHQRGFAREDEANYLGYLACRLHPDADFQYSGYLSALVNVLNALHPYVKPDVYKQLVQTIGPGVRRDLAFENAFWAKHEGPVADVSDKVNDTYLKANMQRDGVQSYGRMVDLLLAEYRAEAGKGKRKKG